jgi:CheY-like chemotaxis protein
VENEDVILLLDFHTTLGFNEMDYWREGNMEDEPKHHPQILIVEDEPNISELMSHILEIEDQWQTTAVNCGEHAIAAWDEADFDVILMDLEMPEMNGIEATKQIREHEKRSGRKRTPIIAFTAHVRDSDREDCINAGCDDFIAKPFNLQTVIDTIYKHIT